MPSDNSRGLVATGPQGPFFIKIYVHALARNNGTNGPSNQQIEEAIAAMRKVYAAHNIYFIRDCDIIQINSTELADIADDAGRCLIEQYATHSDGIDIFIGGDNLPGFASALDVPSKAFLIKGAYNNGVSPVVLSTTNAVSHEMGHCLGLWHTFHGHDSGVTCDGQDPDPTACPEFVNGSNSTVCGDYVTDTPADFGWIGIYPDCVYNLHFLDPNGDPYAPNPKLIMGYAWPTCLAYHTEGQGERMRKVIATSSLLQACLVQPANMVNPVIPAGTNPTWTTANTPNGGDFLIEGDLTIQSGARLTIDPGVKVHFGRDSRVIVKPDGILRLKGTLTGMGCEDVTWQGVQLWGSAPFPKQSQQPVNGALAQGRLVGFPGANLEHARVGVQLYGPTSSYAGGQILCDRTTFRNNIRGVVFAPYSNFWPPSGKPRPYVGVFDQCTFVTDNAYLHSDRFSSFIEMTGVDGVNIAGTTFTNTQTIDGTTAKDWGYGIEANDAGFYVKPASLSATAAHSTFSGLGCGIYALKLSTNRPYVAVQCDFNECFTGIRNSRVSGSTIILNNFNIGKAPKMLTPTQKLEGVIFEQDITGFTCEENHFTAVSGPSGVQTVGTVCVHTGEMNKTIRRNTFTGLKFGNVANQINSHYGPDGIRGLYYGCNQVFGSLSNDFTVPDGTIKARQGLELPNGTYGAAGNNFAYTATDFFNKSPVITYYYKPIGNQEPITFNNGVFPTEALSLNPCDVNYCNPPCRSAAELNDIKKDYYDKKAEYTTLKSDYGQSPTEAKKVTLAYYQRIMDEEAYTVVLHAMYDTLDYNVDTLHKWIGNLNSLEGDLWLASEYLSEGHTTSAIGLLNLAPTKYELPSDVQADLNNYKAMINLLDGKQVYKLDTATQMSLRNYLNSGGYAEAWAKNILTFYGSYFPPEYITVANAQKPAGITAGNIPVDRVKWMTTQPNPARDAVMFTFALPEGASGVALRVFDVNGRAVFQKDCLPSFGNYIWETDDNPPGIYFYQLLSEGAIRESGKLIISK